MSNSTIKRMNCRWIMGTVMGLTVAVFPVNFALAQGKQLARQAVKRAVDLAARGITGPLLDQINEMDIGDIELNRDGSITLTRPEGTYVFDNLVRHKSGEVSGTVSVFDPSGFLDQKLIFNKGINVVDRNRVDFEATVDHGAGVTQMVSGSLTAFTTKSGEGIVTLNTGAVDELSEPYLVDFSGLSNSSLQTASATAPVTIQSMDDNGSVGGVASVLGCAVVIFCVMVFLCAIC